MLPRCAHDEWIDIDGVDLIVFGDELTDTQEHLFQQRDVDRPGPSYTGQERITPDASDHLHGIPVRDRHDAEGNILEHFDMNPTQTEHAHGAELRVAKCTQYHLLATGDHFLGKNFR